MSLQLYQYDEDNNQYIQISEDGLQTQPIQTTHDGTNGEVVEKKMFIRNNDANIYYNNISLRAKPDSKVRVGDINYPEAFIGYKIIYKETQPSESEWASVQSGNEEIIDNIGTTDAADNSYKPFWIQVTIPAGTKVGAFRDVNIEVIAEQNPLGA